MGAKQAGNQMDSNGCFVQEGRLEGDYLQPIHP